MSLLKEAQRNDPKNEKIGQILKYSKKKLSNKKSKYFVIGGFILLGISILFDDIFTFEQRITIDIVALILLVFPSIMSRIKK